MFKFIPEVNRVKVCSDLEVPASFVRVINDVHDNGSIKRHVLQITKDGLDAGLVVVIKALREKEDIKFEMMYKGDSIMIIDAAIASENNATQTVVIGRVVSVFTPATYRKLE